MARLDDFHETRPELEPRGFVRLTPLSQAVAALAAHCGQVAPTRTPLDHAADRIAAEAVRAPGAVPPRPVALREGWAVAAQETLGASNYAPGFASATPLRVRQGDALPDFADAVLPLASVAAHEILSPAAPGEGARAKGGDFTKGEIIVCAGEKLRPVHVALMRLAGISEANLRIPRVRIISRGGGDWLGAMAAREGAEYRLDATEAGGWAGALAEPDADLVIVVGPAGADEPVAQYLANRGKLLAHGLAVEPGQAMGCGILRADAGGSVAAIVFAPERIECQLAAWLLLARPCLRRLAGACGPDLGENLGLARKITSNPGIADLVLLRRIIGAGGAGMWEPLATGDLPWAAIAHADAWLLVEPECEGYAVGQTVCAQFL